MRSRILGWSVLLLAVAFASTTAATHVFLTRELDARVNAELDHEIAEFRVLEAQRAAGPDNGSANSVPALLHARISQAVLERDTVLVGLVDGRIVAISGNSSVAELGASPALLAKWSAVAVPAGGTVSRASGGPAGAGNRVTGRAPATGDGADGSDGADGGAGSAGQEVAASHEDGTAVSTPSAARRNILPIGAAALAVSGSALLADGPARYRAVPASVSGASAAGVFVAVVLTGQSQAAIARTTRLQAEIGTIALLLGTVVAWLIAGRVLRPLRDTTELARRITDTDISDRIPVPAAVAGRRRGRGRSEISELAHTLNRMLDRLETALSAQRRFLADAGHELRTPITIVQGNLDTLRVSTDEDTATLEVAFDELTRMARLVDELTLLARSEQPDFLHPVPTDLGELTRALAAKARALDVTGERRVILTASAIGQAVLDPQRITQAVVQLAANAVAHTPPGTPIEISSTITGDAAEFRVADHGPGIPPDLRGRVFERFARLDSRRTDGSGLGLSIVAAICAAHGGTVRLDDRGPDVPAAGTVPAATSEGAAFTISIPLRRPVYSAHSGHSNYPGHSDYSGDPAVPVRIG